MSGEYEQIPERFIRDLGADRRELVEALKKNDTNLDALVDHLYPDTAHLVFELLQNAEDKGATSARFELSEMKLSFTHDGRPFSKEDIRRITNYGRSAEYEEKDTIGRFGIGFKSVFGCTETPKIYSDTVAFEIVDRIVPRAIPRPASSIRLSMRETVIELPFNGKMKAADEAQDEIRSGLKRMSAMSILHLASIKSIRWRTYDGSSGQISRIELEDGVVRIAGKRTLGEDKRWFLRFREPYAEGRSMHLDVVYELQERESGQETLWAGGEALGDHFRIVPAERGSVAVFFPADKETSNLRFHLHAPFIPELSRASIKEHPENVSLLERLAALVARSLPTLRDLGLLDREFLGVLPSSQDPLPQAYKPFHRAIVQAMRKEPLVPIQGGGHGAATRLLQGPANLKGFLEVEDIHFLMSGWDAPYGWGPRINRSTNPASNYQGWSVSATQRNTAVDRLLGDLTIDAFKVEYLVPPGSKKRREIAKWFATHDDSWHRAYYASVDRYWDTSGSAYDRLRRLPIVRTLSGEHRPADDCRFANDGDDAPEGVAIADPDTYSAGKGAKDARKGLERLGVREIDDESRAVGVLDKHYGDSDNRPSWDQHRSHIERFIELVRSRKVAAATLQGYRFLLNSVEDWEPPRNLYAGNGYAASSAAPYYRSLERLSQLERRQCPVRCELHGRYRDIPGFDEFAGQIGVAYKRIPIKRVGCRGNPEWRHLQSGGGVYFTDYGTDRDWKVPNLDAMLQRLEQAQQPQTERRDLATAIHATLNETSNTWPPPEYCASDADVSGCLVAIYRRNTNASFRAAPSQLVFTLRSRAWVPQEDGEDGLVFVKPSEARAERLPEGFSLDPGWAWVKATEFGKDLREQQRRIAQAERDQEAIAGKRAAVAKDLGFENLEAAEEGKWFAKLPEEERKAIRERQESRNRSPPRFDPPKNAKLRQDRAKEQAKEAPSRKSERRERSIVVGEPALKEEARAKLRANYEEYAHLSLCQVIGCEDRSFKLNGTWYFEAVRFLGLDKMVADDYVALCPRHAAMYLNAKQSDGLMQRFTETCADGNHVGGMTIPVVLAGEDMDIFLVPKHAIDLGAALEVDGERDSVG